MSLIKHFIFTSPAQHVARTFCVVPFTDDHNYTFHSFHWHSSPTYYSTINQTSIDVLLTRDFTCADSSNSSFGPVPDSTSPTRTPSVYNVPNGSSLHLVFRVRSDMQSLVTTLTGWTVTRDVEASDAIDRVKGRRADDEIFVKVPN